MPILTDNQPQAAAKNLHLIFKTHLDIGFTDFSRSVAANYWAKFIPQAIETARTLRESGSADRFIWTTGSWLIYEYLEQADAANRQLMEDAILAGDIVWHGLPFTMHSELMDASLFRFGLSLSKRLDERFGRKTIAAKMTDVPGHTRGIVPLLAEAGIEFLHIGVNPASTVPDVPPLFVWQHTDGSSIIVMYQDSYGSVYVEPRTGEAIAFAHTGDNEGPQTPTEVQHNFAHLREQFPNTPVAASTLDAFAAAILPIKSQLPVVTQEIGDTWIHGIGTDPAKVARFRELSRLRRSWVEAEKISTDDKAFDAFSRAMLMIPEHTWALDEKLHLKDYTHYEASSFQQARSTAPFQKMEQSWAEQRSYLDDALNAIKGTPFGDEAERRLARLTPTLPNTEGFTTIDPAALIETVHFRLRFDTQTGAITELVDKKTGREWASPDNPIGLFRYQTFSEADYARFYEDYIRDKEATKHWSVDDYTKPGMGSAAESQFWLPKLQSIFHAPAESKDQYFLELRFAEEASKAYGAPREAFIKVMFPYKTAVIRYKTAVIRFELQWFNKPSARLPEALWFTFAPLMPDPRLWTMDKLNALSSPLDVLPNGNRKLHAVDLGVGYNDSSYLVTIGSMDAPLVAPGEPSLLNFNNDQPDLSKGFHFNLYNNVWGTNFPMWYDDDAKFRFNLSLNI